MSTLRKAGSRQAAMIASAIHSSASRYAGIFAESARYLDLYSRGAHAGYLIA